jgi:hypothetical protein
MFLACRELTPLPGVAIPDLVTGGEILEILT